MPKIDTSKICICAQKLYDKIDSLFWKSFSRALFGVFLILVAIYYPFFMNRKIVFAIIATLLFSIGILSTFGVGKFFRIRWDFIPDTSWALGKPGRVLFDIGPANSGATAGIDVDGYLSWAFWLGNVWWARFNHGDASVDRARVLCDNSVFNDPNILCPLDGFAWSQNAGWIAFSWAFIDGWSGAYYNPASWRIEWFGHSRALGWIPFYADTTTPITLTTQTWVLLNGIGLNFIWRIAIIWNIAGTRIFNVTNQQVGYIFSSINHSEMLNRIRKNVALLTRNANPAELADPFDTKFNYLVHKGSDYDTSAPWWIWPASKKSIIVIWWDMILDQAIIGSDTDTEKALIVLKDELGNGWNIIISEDVGRIYSFIYAEWSIYSGYKTATGLIVPYIGVWVWNIPWNQLYIYGAIVSKNTVGWSLQTPPTCPVIISNCDITNSQLYDINYLRTYDPTDPTQKNVPYDDPRFDNASSVIEYNPWLTSRPPPGIDAILQ